MDKVVYRLRESGLVVKFLHMHLPLEAVTPRKKKAELKPVDITLLMTPLFFLCAGLTGTVFLFIGTSLFKHSVIKQQNIGEISSGTCYFLLLIY